MVFGAIEVACEEAMSRSAPICQTLKPLMGTRVRRLRSGVGADQRPGILNAVLEAICVPPPPVMGQLEHNNI
jgi:hypothetical protein